MQRWILVGLLCSCAAVEAADREFHDIVRTISDEFHTRPTHIPFFGLVNVVTAVARPAGAKHINLAVFEHLGERREGRDLTAIIRRAVGESWKPFIQAVSRKERGQETVLVFQRADGRDCRLLIAAIEHDEATVVEVKLSPEGMQRWVRMPREHSHKNL